MQQRHVIELSKSDKLTKFTLF